MKIKKIVGVPLGIAGFAVGTGFVGEALGSDGLVSAGQTSVKFISPAVNINMGGYLINQLKGLNKRNGK